MIPVRTAVSSGCLLSLLALKALQNRFWMVWLHADILDSPGRIAVAKYVCLNLLLLWISQFVFEKYREAIYRQTVLVLFVALSLALDGITFGLGYANHTYSLWIYQVIVAFALEFILVRKQGRRIED